MVDFHDRRNGTIVGHIDLGTMRPVFYGQTKPKTNSYRPPTGATTVDKHVALPSPPRKPAGPPPLTRSGAPLTESKGPQPNRFAEVTPAQRARGRKGSAR